MPHVFVVIPLVNETHQNWAVTENQEERKTTTRWPREPVALRAVNQTLVEQPGWQQNSCEPTNLLSTNDTRHHGNGNVCRV